MPTRCRSVRPILSVGVIKDTKCQQLKHRLSEEVVLFIVGVNCVQSVDCSGHMTEQWRPRYVVNSLHLITHTRVIVLTFVNKIED